MFCQQINSTKAKKLISSGAILIDVRSPVQFRDGTIAGAINVPLNRISEALKYPHKTKFIMFGESLEDKNLLAAANYLCQIFPNVFIVGNKDDLK